MRNAVSLHRFAVFTAVCTAILLFAGGLVTSTGSGLAVPDWPLSYGMLFPPMVGGILFEHGHRMIAGFVAILATALMVWSWISLRDSRVKWLATGAWVTVIIQAVLGGVTVLLKLPPVVSVSHAAVAQLFFAFVVMSAIATSDYWRNAKRVPVASSRLHWLSSAAIVLIYLQILLGAWMRHTGAGLAIPDFPLSHGNWIPPMTEDALPELNASIAGMPYVPQIESAGQIAIHFAHRVGALVVTLAVLWLCVETIRQLSHEPLFVGLAGLLFLLLMVQVSLGIFTVLIRRPVILTTAHLLFGAFLFTTTVSYAALLRRRFVVERAAVRAVVGEGARA
ncbi:MAG: COX15/CtaA family protein [Candidatus Poribacteria bacterium]|nr:COX15/CtaA family protein [Candidatus Poribacteria bacterium]